MYYIFFYMWLEYFKYFIFFGILYFFVCFIYLEILLKKDFVKFIFYLVFS